MKTPLPKVTQTNYFDPEIELAYMGATQFKAFQACEAAGLARVLGDYRTEPTEAMMIGSYVDAFFSGCFDAYLAQHPEIFLKDGKTLKAAYKMADTIIARMLGDDLYAMLMMGQKQVIRTGEIAGVPFKIKIDSLLDADTCRQIVEVFPGMADVFGPLHVDGAIVDQKVMRNIQDVWSDEDHAYVPFIEAYGYDIQGAIYQAVEGHMLPFILDVGTKEDPPDLVAIAISDDHLDAKLREVEDMAPRYQAIKEGREKPRRCERCPYSDPLLSAE